MHTDRQRLLCRDQLEARLNKLIDEILPCEQQLYYQEETDRIFLFSQADRMLVCRVRFHVSLWPMTTVDINPALAHRMFLCCHARVKSRYFSRPTRDPVGNSSTMAICILHQWALGTTSLRFLWRERTKASFATRKKGFWLAFV